MLENKYDVVIVGGGPGGSTTAKYCAKNGLKVALFEKLQQIGLYKRCGEGWGSLSSEKIINMKIPSFCIKQDVDGFVIFAPNGKKSVVDYGKTMGHILERKEFDKWLAIEASRAGAYVQSKTNVIDVLKENDKIIGVRIEHGGETKEIKSNIVVAADGVESVIARKAGLNTTNSLINIDSGYQFEMSNIEIEDPRKIYFWFDNKFAPRGYIWLFPKGKDVANVGIGVGPTFAKKPASSYLEEWITTQPNLKNGSIIEVNSGAIPVGGFLKNMVLNGFLAVGDAAHQVNPIHGGGLKEAIIAGSIASDVIKTAFDNNDFTKNVLDEYNKIWWKERGESLRKVEKIRNVMEKLSDDDLNYLSDCIDRNDLMELTRGKKLSVLAKILMKNPKLIGLAKHLL